jgi:hypothetical protein
MGRVCALLVMCLLVARVSLGQTLAEWVEAAVHPEDAAQIIDELTARPLDLNDATMPQIAALPGFDGETATRVMTVRDRNGGFRSLREASAELRLTPLQNIALRELCVVSTAAQSVKERLVVTGSAGEQQDRGVTKRSRSRLRYEVQTPDGLHGFALAQQQNGAVLVADDATTGIEFSLRHAPVRVVAGDFQFDHGTGLLASAAYGVSGWMRAGEIATPGEARGILLKPTTSVMSRWRGAAAEFARRRMSLAVGVGENSLDAGLTDDGTAHLIAAGASDDALGESRRGQLRERFALARSEISIARADLSAGIVHSEFEPALAMTSASLPIELTGYHLTTASVAARASARDLSAMIEVAGSQPGRGAVQAAVVERGENIAVAAYTTSVSPRYHAIHGRSWNGFAAQAENESQTGLRIAFTRGRHTIQVGANAEATPFRTATSPLRKTGSAVDARWSSDVNGAVAMAVLAARQWGEDTAEDASALATTRDRARLDLEWFTVPELTMRAELRRAASTGANDADRGTLVSVQVREGIGAWRASARITMFDFESDAVSAATYESALSGEYPLVALAGSGSRSGVTVSRKLARGNVAARLSYQSSQSRTGLKSGWEAAMAWTVNR